MGGNRKTQTETALQRQLTLLVQLMQRPRGMTLSEVQQVMALPKATFYRYVEAISAAGIDLDRSRVSGETRYSVAVPVMHAMAITPEQLDALRVARRHMTALEGTRVTQALDALIRLGARKHSPQPGRVRVRKGRASGPDHLSAITRAFERGCRISIRYRGERDAAPRQRTLDPIVLRHAGEHVYLHAFDVEVGDERNFKLDRISRVEVSRVRADAHAFDEQAFARSIKTWSGDPVTIEVRLSPRVARIANEYPLVDDQTLIDEPDGGARITATVNGVQEAMRWVLGWGREAEALAPESLRQAVADQVRSAAQRYETPMSPPVSVVDRPKVAAKKARSTRSTRLTDRETAAG